MKRTQWFIGLIGLTAAVMILLQGQPWYLPVYAQDPAPATPDAVSEEAPAAEEVPEAAEEVPEAAGEASAPVAEEGATDESPEAATPATAAEEPPASPEATTSPAPSLALAEEGYQDPGQRFQVGLLADYTQTMLAGVPIFESPDRTLAYTVALRPRAADVNLNAGALSQVAIDTFRTGEGLQVGAFEPVTDGARLPWTGTLTMGRNTQPMQGVMLARQVPGRVLLLLIAATAEAADQVEAVYATLEPTLTAPDPA
ncbi:MAG: hypothetical protein IGR80_03060 [Synechococcales cyanobacterium K44_A2020_017]|nr:hypothetical protein [Synechococcales cyanobacterium K32_A2020_035]MBF2093718.1 hypothetical protein [Synechococcales cyanobacterium K44_A2020_017]